MVILLQSVSKECDNSTFAMHILVDLVLMSFWEWHVPSAASYADHINIQVPLFAFCEAGKAAGSENQIVLWKMKSHTELICFRVKLTEH